MTWGCTHMANRSTTLRRTVWYQSPHQRLSAAEICCHEQLNILPCRQRFKISFGGHYNRPGGICMKQGLIDVLPVKNACKEGCVKGIAGAQFIYDGDRKR